MFEDYDPEEALDDLIEEQLEVAGRCPRDPASLIARDGTFDTRKLWRATYLQACRTFSRMVVPGKDYTSLARLLAERHFQQHVRTAALRRRFHAFIEAANRKRLEARVEARHVEEAAAFEADLAAWQERIAWAEINTAVLDLNDPTYERHPIRDALWSSEDPEAYSRRKLKVLHSSFIRVQKAKAEANERRREAGLQQAGKTPSSAEAMAEVLTADAEKAVAEAKADRLYIDGATAILESWKAKGAKLQGVRLPLKANSKPVRWLKARMEGKARKTVARDIGRMAEKQRGWKADLEGYRAFK